ncbi:OLC1v1009757C1 [Oldenlandia corymbosa var. corymbosa]|uniref:Ninja-family protein n=1 Tax=Oldenlandia corymbosa var. corymbosa TaxID=529605 RepID=A0AAV1DS51_OLDCO|nr:OLC1v1009757C1 [Oldenlandia corymbosa var. corymbosa]
MFANYMEKENRDNQETSARLNGFTKDLLVDKFSDRYSSHNTRREAEEDGGGLELSLGLSLNGRFGVDPEKDRIKLARSSSVQPFSLFGGDNNHHAPPQAAAPIAAAAYTPPPLSRTYSLPTEAEAENWKKRKEMQSLRRLEAKRRRMDKIKILRSSGGREKVDLLEDNSSEETGSNHSSNNSNGPVVVNGNGTPPWSQKSVGSQGSSSSSGLSELESQPIQDRNMESRNSPIAQPAEAPQSKVDRGRVAENKVATDEAKKMLKNFMLEMPCVTTIGSGPNGRRVDGFLYRYGKGEEVKIVCVCHGSFLSPAEFIKHAGGAEVENPLRHIVINPSPVL